MIILSINLLILSVGLLIVGLIKPGWILFWMDKPGRIPVIALASSIFMIAVVMFGEANRENKNEKAKQVQQMEKSKENADISVPVPVDSK
ncbi:MAG: hypothetical protein KAH20_06095 [Methylococcales bacterium]|nr:hypothetical protein [Methylococcales bacterium]